MGASSNPEVHAATRFEMDQHNFLSSFPHMVIILDDHGLVRGWNHMAAHSLGLPFQEVHQRPFDDLTLPWDHERVAEGIKTCRDSMACILIDNLHFQKPDAQSGYLKLHITPLLGSSNQAEGGLILLGDDVSDRRILESQVLQSQKLESIGQLAAGVAHEINTPIQFLSDNMRFLKDTIADLCSLVSACQEIVCETSGKSETGAVADRLRERISSFDLEYLLREAPQAIDQSLGGLERVAHIVRSMKSFAHPGEQNMIATDVNKALADTVTVSRNEWKYVAEMHMDLDPNLPPAFCYLSELNQAFLNIVTNAAQAIAEAHGGNVKELGLISIATRHEGGEIVIRISDTGPGIPEHVKSRMFDPFFTTKEVGKGTGQGLAITYNAIVKRHGGSIAVESEVGHGATFVLRIPCSAATDDPFAEFMT